MSSKGQDSRVLSVATSNPKSVDEHSHHSGNAAFPISLPSGSQLLALPSGATAPNRPLRSGNPFKLPPENDIFTLRDQEKQRHKKERARQRQLKVHEKSTYSQKANARSGTIRRQLLEATDDDEDTTSVINEDPAFVIGATKDRHVEKESLANYIAKKREMFLVEYALGVKRDEMRKLEQIAQEEEKKLEQAEKYLEEDALMFDEFLKENDKNSVEAIKAAEAETKLKLEKVNEIKGINAKIMSLKSELSKNEEQLQEFKVYKKFLERLAPQEWRDKLDQKRKKKMKGKPPEITLQKTNSTSRLVQSSSRVSLTDRGKKLAKTPSVVSFKKSSRGYSRELSGQETESQVSIVSSTISESSDDSDDECEIFFTDPQQLLDIFTELEEQNLSLIQNSQETEEALEEMRQMIAVTEERMNKETHSLKIQIEVMEAAIQQENDKAAELEHKAKMFNFGEFKAEDQEQMLTALNKKVGEVYRNCIGENEANITTLHMLTSIENRLEELFEQLDMLPAEKVEAAEKAKEKERRLHALEKKKEEERLLSEERARRALERARAEPKKQTGKKLVFRSEPPQAKKKQKESSDALDKEQEELQYYFS
ncbi:cilia- and flagella-associated protein 100-like [Oscarella lobularis]|uniref:cilia- and flagella-associated protein 100-like n=1 Tax=Oscarella lobularis TaxID=121494 RepID=UPI0033142315